MPGRPARAALIGLAPALLAACEPGTFPVSLNAERQAAEQVAAQVLAARDPIVPIEPVANCVAVNASAEEATAIAEAGRTGDIAAANAALDLALRRQTTQTCLENNGVPDFGLT